jgi:hypothetical protein
VRRPSAAAEEAATRAAISAVDLAVAHAEALKFCHALTQTGLSEPANQPPDVPRQVSLSAPSGSVRAARRAGTALATSVTTPRITTIVT